MQQTDYPLLEPGLPPYEPRGCQRGISASWYVYSPIRVKYPYVRGPLLDLWREAKSQHSDPVEAWGALVEDPAKAFAHPAGARQRRFPPRQVGRRVGVDRRCRPVHGAQVGAGPGDGLLADPGDVVVLLCGGLALSQLFGGVNMSFYDWYADLPTSFPEVWGDQTDVCESADWYNSKFIVSMASNLNMTRTPDVHFIAEARTNGAKFVVLSPDFSQVAKYGDEWIPVQAGQDGALWMAVNHVILKEFYVDRQVPYFLDYLKRYTDCPFLVELVRDGKGYRAGQLLRANRLARYKDVENGDWKMLVLDAKSGEPRMPKGQVGFRWGQRERQVEPLPGGRPGQQPHRCSAELHRSI